MIAMKNLHQIKAYSLVITVVGLFFYHRAPRIQVELQKVKKKRMMLFCSCAAGYAKAKSKAYTYAVNNIEHLHKDLVKSEYERLKIKIQKEKIEASRCIRNWALDQESYWYEDQLVGPDFQGKIKLANPKSCKGTCPYRELGASVTVLESNRGAHIKRHHHNKASYES